MQDHIVRAITKDGFLKATAICSTGIAERARQIHHTPHPRPQPRSAAS